MADRFDPNFLMPTIVALGDSAILVRFGTILTDGANRAANALAAQLDHAPIGGVVEVMPNLISVLLRYDPLAGSLPTLLGELRLMLSRLNASEKAGTGWTLPVVFDGPDLGEVATALGLSVPDFIAEHNREPLRVLATGFAPGFVYCGMHDDALVLPRRRAVRPAVPAGSVLFAAGQTAVTATEMPTGWHVIGHTDFRNFDALAEPPTRLLAGDAIVFEAAR